MSWTKFLQAIIRSKEYRLTVLESQVLMCIEEHQTPTKKELLGIYCRTYSDIEEEAFTQRLKSIYKKFGINGKGHKLPQLHRFLAEKYVEYQNKDVFFTEVGLTHIHPDFPRDRFGREIDKVIHSERQEQESEQKFAEYRRVDILQTFAPNLDDYSDHLCQCIQNCVQVRILLAWPYSEAAKLRESVLRKYADGNVSSDINICDRVISNLETLEKVVSTNGSSKYLEIKLYDTLPSLAIYRAGDYMLAAPFLHGALAVETFQLELNLDTSNKLITETLQEDFGLMWEVGLQFSPDPDRNWRSDLKILFAELR